MCLSLAETSATTRATVDTARVTCYLPNAQPGYIAWKEVYVSDTEITSSGSGSAPATVSSCVLVDGYVKGNAWCELGAMTLTDAQVVGLCCGLVWATAWGFKAIRRSISVKGNEE